MVMNEPNEKAARGLKLLSARHRTLHPRAQVQTLRRIAARSLSAADWQVELAQRHPDLCPLDQAKVDRLQAKAFDAIEACLWLNQEHELGFPVPR